MKHTTWIVLHRRTGGKTAGYPHAYKVHKSNTARDLFHFWQQKLVLCDIWKHCAKNWAGQNFAWLRADLVLRNNSQIVICM